MLCNKYYYLHFTDDGRGLRKFQYLIVRIKKNLSKRNSFLLATLSYHIFLMVITKTH